MSGTDIYGYDKWMARTKRYIAKLPILEKNKALLLEFEKGCLAEGIGIARRAKYLRHMTDVAREFLPVSFTRCTKKDILAAVGRIEAREGYSPYTKRDAKATIRKFFTWLAYRDDPHPREDIPDLVSWIRPSIKRRDVCRVKASDLVTAEEVERMIQVTQNPRNRALIAMLYELGARIGEVAGLRVGDISRDEYSLLADLDGKTGKRTVRIVLYASYVVSWMNLHPGRGDPRSSLFPSVRPKRLLQPLCYAELVKIIKVAAARAGVQKRIYPHLFRHSRATHLLAAGKMNEAQAKVFFGWVADSKILSTYAHLVTRDANDAVLRMYGIARTEAKAEEPSAACGMCKTANPRTGAFCYRCGYALGIDAGDKVKERISASEGVLLRLLQKPEVREILKGMVDDDRRTSSTSNSPPVRAAPPAEPSVEDVRRHRKEAA